MRGQLAIDYLIALIIFVSFATYMAFQVMALMPTYLNQLRVETLRSEAWQVSDLLINDVGEPANWHVGGVDIKRVGLSAEAFNKTNLLSLAKAEKFNETCQTLEGYVNLSRWMGMAGYQFSLTMAEPGRPSPLIDCRPPQPILKPRVTSMTIRRVVALDSGSHAMLTLEVW
jgi:hypothetical protein